MISPFEAFEVDRLPLPSETNKKFQCCEPRMSSLQYNFVK